MAMQHNTMMMMRHKLEELGYDHRALERQAGFMAEIAHVNFDHLSLYLYS